jgi:hypothetical protein
MPGNHMICTPPSQTPSVADRVKILTGAFPDDAYLRAWRMLAAADDFQRNKRPDPLGGFCSEIARSFPGALCASIQVRSRSSVPDLVGSHPLFEFDAADEAMDP